MVRCSFFILSAARSRALRTVVPLPSPTVVPFLSSRTACAAALSLAFSTQLILVRLPFCFYLFEAFHGFEDFFADGLDLLFSLVPRLLPWRLFFWRRVLFGRRVGGGGVFRGWVALDGCGLAGGCAVGRRADGRYTREGDT